MAGKLQKVRPGDPLAIPAGTYNAFVDAARAYQEGVAGQAPRPSISQAGIVLVANDSGADRDRFEVLGIDAPVFTPAESEDAFTDRVVLSCSTPAAAHAGLFVVLLEPLPSSAIGLAVISGVTVCKIDVVSAAHRFADVADGQAGYLASGHFGAAQILWRESGTGQRWAIVRLGPSEPVGLYGKVLVTGSAGDPAWVTDGTATGNGCYVDVNPSAADGTDPDTATTHRVKLPRNGRREDPNVRQGDVICYVRDQTGQFVAPSGLLDGKVGESVRIFKGAPADVPKGWEIIDKGLFYVGYDDGDADYSAIGNTGGYKLHGGEDEGAANNHEDHDPAVVSGTGVNGWTAGQIKGWLDGSWLHSETDNRPPYIVRAWIERVD